MAIQQRILENGLNLSPTLTSLILMAGVLFVVLTAAAYTIWVERRVSAWIQNRVGPNRVGPAGLLQPLADVIKLVLKEDIIPVNANKAIHSAAPVISVLVAVATFAVIPVARGFVIADVNIGVLYILALTSLGVYGVTLAGWSSNSKYSLLGGLRSSAQMISYELSMGLALVAVILLSGRGDAGTTVGSLTMTQIVESQTANPLGWNLVLQFFPGFWIFFTAAFAETNRLPFDLPEAEQELVGGYHTEYSSMKFALFFVAEYINMVVSSAVLATLYLGGYQLPIGRAADQLLEAWMTTHVGHWAYTGAQITAFALKTCIFIFIFVWVRWTLPRFKYDQLMNLGWKAMLPLALLNVFLTATMVLITGGNLWAMLPFVLINAVITGGIVMVASRHNSTLSPVQRARLERRDKAKQLQPNETV